MKIAGKQLKVMNIFPQLKILDTETIAKILQSIDQIDLANLAWLLNSIRKHRITSNNETKQKRGFLNENKLTIISARYYESGKSEIPKHASSNVDNASQRHCDVDLCQ